MADKKEILRKLAKAFPGDETCRHNSLKLMSLLNELSQAAWEKDQDGVQNIAISFSDTTRELRKHVKAHKDKQEVKDFLKMFCYE
jgi:hypothetical protein